MDNIELALKQLVSRLTHKKVQEEICLTDSLELDLGFDSLAMIEFMVAIEETFGITISDDDLLNQEDWAQTIGSVTSFVGAKVGTCAAA